MVGERTRVELGRREDLGADCANCFGLCCAALAFAKSSDFPFDKPAGEPCINLDDQDACHIHLRLRDHGFKGCTVFECFGAGQKVSQRTFAAHSWREDPQTRAAMFAVFPIVRRVHELLWYLEQAITLVEAERDTAPWENQFARVLELSNLPAEELMSLDIDSEYDTVRRLLIKASDVARQHLRKPKSAGRGRPLGPGRDLMGARLVRADLRGVCLRGSTLVASDLTGAKLAGCDVLGVDMRDADLSGADLVDAIFLTQMQVNSARGDVATRLPPGFGRPPHWTAR